MGRREADGQQVRFKRSDLAVPLVAGAVYAAIGLVWVRWVYLSDFFQMIWLADAQRAGVATAWANGFLGLGYPALLNLVTGITGNVLTSGKLIQILSGVAILALLPWALRTCFDDDRGAWLAQGLVAIDPIVLTAAAGETPDLLATAFMLPGLIVAVGAARDRPVRARTALLAGVLLGLAYLVRYHALLLAGLATVLLLVVTRRAAVAGACAGGFLMAAAPQLAASWWVQGQPFYNLHIKSISIGYYGTTSDFVQHTKPWTLWRILTTSPVDVARGYALHVARHFTAVGGSLVLLAGIVLARQREGRAFVVLASPMAGLLLLLSAKFYTDRAVLLPLVVGYLVIARALAWALSEWRLKVSVGAAALLVAGLASVALLEDGRRLSRFRRMAAINGEVTSILRKHGIRDSRMVFTTHLSYYLADDPTGGAFHPHDTWLLYDPNYARAFPHSYFSDVASLTAFVRREGIRFLLLGPLTGELAPEVLAAQRTGDLGPDYTLIGRWPDLFLFEYRPAR